MMSICLVGLVAAVVMLIRFYLLVGKEELLDTRKFIDRLLVNGGGVIHSVFVGDPLQFAEIVGQSCHATHGAGTSGAVGDSFQIGGVSRFNRRADFAKLFRGLF